MHGSIIARELGGLLKNLSLGMKRAGYIRKSVLLDGLKREVNYRSLVRFCNNSSFFPSLLKCLPSYFRDFKIYEILIF